MDLIFPFLHFQIQNVETQNCLDTMGRKANEPIGSSYCHGLGGNQVFAYTKRKQIMSDDNCLDAAHPRGPVKLVRCHGMGGNQEWKYDEEVTYSLFINFVDKKLIHYLIHFNFTQEKTIKHVNSGNCLSRATADDPSTPLLRPCDYSEGQQWLMKSQFKWQAN